MNYAQWIRMNDPDREMTEGELYWRQAMLKYLVQLARRS